MKNTKRSLIKESILVNRADMANPGTKSIIAWMFVEKYEDGSWRLWNELIAPTRNKLIQEARDLLLDAPNNVLKPKKVRIELM